MGEFRPCFRCRVLAAKFALAVAPTAAGNDRGNPAIGTARKDRDRSTETAADQSNFAWIDFRPSGQIGDGISRIGYLIETDDAPVLTLALAATAKIDTQGDVAPLGELFGDDGLALPVFVPAKAVQDYKGWPALTGFMVGRCIDQTGNFQTIRLKRYFFFHYASSSFPAAKVPCPKALLKIRFSRVALQNCCR